ncbi:MAG: class I SAM-dependent RNA methyltransferase [Deltaproteobacteria bacterium]|nr:class I SAM-dependent RNA methyltransferase [Deltaproteobacteria bacterium]MCB9786981.1 class I SAM-dependent RNA methyltransferase [Deltaproteobacteria bacterium]
MELTGLEILRWAHGGDGVGVPVQGELAGAVVFVPRAVPGDVVRCRIVRRKKRWARAELVAIERSSPHRVTPVCPVQAECGGCPWMAGAPAAQAASRRAILGGEVDKRLGASQEVVRLAPPAGATLGYRARVRMAWEVDARGQVRLGYRAPGSHRLVDVPGCPVAAPAIEAALPALRELLSERGPGRGEVSLVAGREGVAGRIAPERGAPIAIGPPSVTLGEEPYAIRADAETFVQANPAVARAIAEQVEAMAREAGGRHAVELFAGAGTLTLPLLRAGYRVTAYESAAGARAWFHDNVAGRGEATWHLCDLLATGVPWPAPEPPDLVLLDPPRTGALEMMAWVRACGARVVLMVSCDVSTAMRDLAALVEGGAWAVTDIVGHDMFPHTGHQEVVARAVRT